jgi:hypothetical protein
VRQRSLTPRERDGIARQPSDWVDRRALDARRELVGVIVDAYTDPHGHRVERLAVPTG